MGGKNRRCVGLTTLPPSCVDSLEIPKASNSWVIAVCPGLSRIALPFITLQKKKVFETVGFRCGLSEFFPSVGLLQSICWLSTDEFTNGFIYRVFEQTYRNKNNIRVLSLNRHCATSRKVSGSIPDGVTEDFLRSYRRNHLPRGRLSL